MPIFIAVIKKKKNTQMAIGKFINKLSKIHTTKCFPAAERNRIMHKTG
jgi:hypothetical protein